MRNGGDLLLAYAEAAQRFAMLREDKLASLHPSCPGLAEFAQDGVDLARRVAVNGKPVDCMLQDIGRQCENRPPVPRRSCCRARFRHWVPITKQAIIIGENRFVGGLGAGNLAQHGHR